MENWENSVDEKLLTCTFRVVYAYTCCVLDVYLCIQTMSSLTRTHNSLSGMRFYDETKSDVLSARLAACECNRVRGAIFSLWICGRGSIKGWLSTHRDYWPREYRDR